MGLASRCLHWGTAGGHKGRPYKLVGDFVGAGFIPARLLCVRGQLRSGGLREGDHGLEEVSVDVQTEGAALELGEAAGNGQAQAGASVVRDSSPRTNRSMSRSAGMLRGWREMFLMDRTTLPSQRHTST